MMRLKIPFLFSVLIFSIAVNAQQKRTVDFTGGARSLLTSNKLTASDSLPDTTSTKRNTGGYALIDLGVDIKPNKQTEIMGMFRIRNEYGGFWGSGVSFNVRQLWLKGIVGDVLRYQVGDLNLKQTAFTLYNHQADEFDSLPSVFNLQSQIIAYEKFYQKNTWRQQGANIDFGFKFSKYLKEADFRGYLTRLQATNFSTIPERLMGGATATIIQSKHLGFGYDGFYVFDVKGTIPDTNIFKNNVNTFNVVYTKPIKENTLEIKAEGGTSNIESSENKDASTLSDYFIHAYGKMKFTKQHAEVVLGYLNVGPDFRSIGAQSKNINYNASPNYYNLYSNAQVNRPISVMDVIGNDNIYSTSINKNLLPTSQVYNNIMPYGLATFNRIGGYVKAVYQNEKGLMLNLQHFNLSEIRGQGTLLLSKFTRTKLNAQLEVNKLAKFKRTLKVQFNADMQTTKRKSDFAAENVDLKTTFYTIGLEYEVFTSIDVLCGIVGGMTKGNDFLPERNSYTKVEFLSGMNYDLNQQLGAFGVRCRFTPKAYLCALYQFNSYTDKLKILPEYQINQFALIYNLTF